MNTSTAPPLNVSMEVCDEFMVQEIYPDGTEIYKQPLTMSENFARIINRIDFEKLSVALNDQGTSAQFDSIKAKIMQALTNVSVMHDVIKVGKEQEYLVIDRVAKDVNKSEEKPITVLRLQAEQNQVSRTRVDFHAELLAMRQSWRLRKKGSTILGDLSYRSAGSMFAQPGTFEVVRNENQTPQNPSALRIIIPKSLEGGNFFVVRTNKDSKSQFKTLFEPLKLHNPPSAAAASAAASSDQPWQAKLESIQNMLFNNELFNRLARESVQLKLPIPTIAAGNQIIASLFPGLQLSINLCHTLSSSSSGGSAASSFEALSGNNAVLEHTLHQLLYKIHYRNLHHPLPHPASATLATNSVRFFCGPRAYDREMLTQLTHSETILEQVIQQGQHSMLRLRTMCLIDSLAIEVQDPLIVPCWNYLNSPTETSVRIDLYSFNYEALNGCRTSVMLHIGTRTVKAILRDGRVMNLSFESQELRHFLLNLIAQHQLLAVQTLAKATGWRVISLTPNVGVGKQEPVCGTATSITILSSNGSRMLSVKSGPHSGIKVKLSSAPQEFFFQTELVNNPQWEQLNGPFKTVDWPRIPGKTFVNKMEYLMACLSCPSSSVAPNRV
ncbi:Mediator of RNA polymerase II transcription subunit 17 [Tyrophagus putrescentiae]|nr:Mediator of RNA polymerase II transcription subunit 17 [Tyrophagus putrescentiae]